MLPNQTWVRFPVCSKASPLMPGCGDGKHSIYCRAPSKENGQFMLKRSKLPDGFQGRGFKGSQCEGGGCRVRDELVHNYQIGRHQGEVSSIINLLVSPSLGSMCLWSAVFIWWSSASCKNNLGMFVRLLFTSFKEPAMWQIYSLNHCQFPSPPAILCFYIFMFPNH